MSLSGSDPEVLVGQQQGFLLEAQRRLAVRDQIDQRRRLIQQPPAEVKMETGNRPSVFSHRLPRSGNAALAASALLQAVLGIEFTLSGLNKLADPHYVSDFATFVRSSPGAIQGALSLLVQALVLPDIAVFARLIEVSELLIGLVLLVGAVDIFRRRFAGRLGAEHGYEAPLALASAIAGVAAAGLTLSIALLMGEGLPGVAAGRAFSSAIPIELFIVPLGVAIAWLELGRFGALRPRHPAIARGGRLARHPLGA